MPRHRGPEGRHRDVVTAPLGPVSDHELDHRVLATHRETAFARTTGVEPDLVPLGVKPHDDAGLLRSTRVLGIPRRGHEPAGLGLVAGRASQEGLVHTPRTATGP